MRKGNIRDGWRADPAFRLALRGAVIGLLIAMLGVFAVFIGQAMPNTLVENAGAGVALTGLAISAVAVIASFALGVRSLWRRTS
jgi:hypothetical protein